MLSVLVLCKINKILMKNSLDTGTHWSSITSSTITSHGSISTNYRYLPMFNVKYFTSHYSFSSLFKVRSSACYLDFVISSADLRMITSSISPNFVNLQSSSFLIELSRVLRILQTTFHFYHSLPFNLDPG